VPGYEAFIENLNASPHATSWRIRLNINGVPQEISSEYDNVDEALTVLKKRFEQ